jgi:hypothetical protein
VGVAVGGETGGPIGYAVAALGEAVVAAVGRRVAAAVGKRVGVAVGRRVDIAVGRRVGVAAVGRGVGVAVGGDVPTYTTELPAAAVTARANGWAGPTIKACAVTATVHGLPRQAPPRAAVPTVTCSVGLRVSGGSEAAPGPLPFPLYTTGLPLPLPSHGDDTTTSRSLRRALAVVPPGAGGSYHTTVTFNGTVGDDTVMVYTADVDGRSGDPGAATSRANSAVAGSSKVERRSSP